MIPTGRQKLGHFDPLRKAHSNSKIPKFEMRGRAVDLEHLPVGVLNRWVVVGDKSILHVADGQSGFTHTGPSHDGNLVLGCVGCSVRIPLC